MYYFSMFQQRKGNTRLCLSSFAGADLPLRLTLHTLTHAKGPQRCSSDALPASANDNIAAPPTDDFYKHSDNRIDFISSESLQMSDYK